MDKFLKAFREQYHLPEIEWAPQLWEKTASCLQESYSILVSSLSGASVTDEIAFYLRIAENSVGRLYDTSSAMVACLACGTTGGVESLARVVVEGAWTTRFLMEGDFKKRMFAYLFQYTREHPRKLAEWKKIVETARPGDLSTLSAIEGRKTYIEGMHDLIEKIRETSGQPEIEELSRHWMTALFKRCESLGEAEKYYTYYHRLSADSHQSAEQTIQHLHGYLMEAAMGMKGALEQIRRETVHYSAMMAALAVDEAIVAAVTTCDRFDADYDRATIDRVRLELRAHADTLCRNAGAPF